MSPTTNWESSGKHVLAELKRISESIEGVRKDQVALRMDFLTAIAEVQEKFMTEMQQVKIDIALLKLKAGVWGLIGGAIPVAVGLLVWFLKG